MARAPRTAGERWSREQLEALLARRFSPPAVGAFLVASQRRAGEVRAARPALAAQERRWLLAGAGAHVLLAVARPADVRPGLPGALAWWGATGLMLDWHLGMLETEDGRERPLGAADAVTLARAWAVPLAARGAGPALVLAAWGSDGLDGALARRAEPTRLGRDLEGVADAAFAAAALRGALRAGRLPGWAVAAEGVRLAAGFAYALGVWFGRAEAPDSRVLRAGRTTTPLRVAGLVAAATGRRRTAGTLVGGGSAWALAAVLQGAVGREGGEVG